MSPDTSSSNQILFVLKMLLKIKHASCSFPAHSYEYSYIGIGKCDPQQRKGRHLRVRLCPSCSHGHGKHPDGCGLIYWTLAVSLGSFLHHKDTSPSSLSPSSASTALPRTPSTPLQCMMLAFGKAWPLTLAILKL